MTLTGAPAPLPGSPQPAPTGAPCASRPPVDATTQRLGADFERSLARQQDSQRSGGHDGSAAVDSGASSVSHSDTEVSYAVRGHYGDGNGDGDPQQQSGTPASFQTLARGADTPASFGTPAAPADDGGLASGTGGSAGAPVMRSLRATSGPATPGAATSHPPAGATPAALQTMQSLRAAQGATGTSAAGGTGATRPAASLLSTSAPEGEPSADALAGLLGQPDTRPAIAPAGDGAEESGRIGAAARHGGRGKGTAGTDEPGEAGQRAGELFTPGALPQAAPAAGLPTAAGQLPPEASKTQAALETALRHSMPATDLAKAGSWEVSIPQPSGGTLELKATRAAPVGGHNMNAAWNLDIRTTRQDAEAFARQQSRLAERLAGRRVATHIRIEGSDEQGGDPQS